MTLIDDHGHIRHPNVEDVIREVKAKAAGRTRYVGQEPRWDELLVAEIDALRRDREKLLRVYETATRMVAYHEREPDCCPSLMLESFIQQLGRRMDEVNIIDGEERGN